MESIHVSFMLGSREADAEMFLSNQQLQGKGEQAGWAEEEVKVHYRPNKPSENLVKSSGAWIAHKIVPC